PLPDADAHSLSAPSAGSAVRIERRSIERAQREARPMTGQDWLELGRIGSPYGIKGWVHVQSFTDPPERLLKYRDWLVQSGRVEPAARKVAEGRAHGDGLVARLDGIDDRDRAAKLQGAAIRVARSALPKLKKREFY